FVYDADGNLTDSYDPVNHLVPPIHTEYEAKRGWKKSVDDPDLGHWDYVHDGFGDLISQADPQGPPSTMTYDALGRMLTRTDAEGTAQWVYDKAEGAGIGKVAAMVSPADSRLNGPCSIPGISPGGANQAGRWFKYTPSGDIDEIHECTDGETFVTSYQYDL